MGAAIFHFSLHWTMYKCNMALCVSFSLSLCFLERVWHVTCSEVLQNVLHVELQLCYLCMYYVHAFKTVNPKISLCFLPFTYTLLIFFRYIVLYRHYDTHTHTWYDALPCQQFNVIEIIAVSVHSFGHSFSFSVIIIIIGGTHRLFCSERLLFGNLHIYY